MLDVIFICSVGTVTGMVASGLKHRRLTQRRQAWYQAFAEAQPKLPASSPPRLSQSATGPSLRLQHAERVFHIQAEVLNYDTLQTTVTLPTHRSVTPPRIWIGWDVEVKTPPNWHHVARLPLVSEGLRGNFVAYGDDVLAAQRMVDRSFLDLLDARRESQAHAITLDMRSDYVRLKFYRCSVSPYFIERNMRVADRVAERWLKTFTP